jgi:hypothetical protein
VNLKQHIYETKDGVCFKVQYEDVGDIHEYVDVRVLDNYLPVGPNLVGLFDELFFYVGIANGHHTGEKMFLTISKEIENELSGSV